MARKKYHVVLVTLSPKLEDGSRDTINKAEICSCNERGTAELIKQFMTEKYKSAGFNMDLKNEQIRFVKLSVV